MASAEQTDATPPTSGTGAAAGDSHTVTLITGDQVRVDSLTGGGTGISVQPGRGREHVEFVEHTVGDTVSVLPADALPLVEQGVLDPRLFDVTGLVEMGYDDAARNTLPLIVQYADTASASAPLAALAGAATPGAVLTSVHGQAIAEHKTQATTFWAGLVQGGAPDRALRAGVSRVWLDGRVSAALDVSVPQIGAPQAWATGLTGSGVVTAVLDTGIDTTHPDLADAVVEARDFTGDPDGAADGHGHGTHVASTITGNGSASGGRYAGVAPDTRLLVGKVLNDQGDGTESQIIAGMQWAAERAKVINMSLGSRPTDGTDPMSQAVNALTEQTGALFVIAAGNDGRLGAETVSSPATADAALAVGAVDKQDQLAAFSSRGPRVGDGAVKPEITAPGVGIVAARASGTDLGEPVDEHYTALNGTSMATPHVAGAAAILAQQHPDWRAEQLKAALTSTARPSANTNAFAQGSGRVDVARGVAQSAHAEPAAVSAHLPWPHTTPVTRTVTYHNDGDTALALALAVGGVPAGLVSVEPAAVTVPAHGSAAVTLTIDATNTPSGSHGGALTATSPDGATVIRTALGVLAEDERFELSVDVVNREGQHHPRGGTWLVNLDTGEVTTPTLSGETYTARLPRGRYSVEAVVFSAADAATRNTTTMLAPEVTVDHDGVSVTLDARAGRPVTAAVDSTDVAPVFRWLGVSEKVAGVERQMQTYSASAEVEMFAVPTPAVTDRPFTFTYTPTLATPAGATPNRAYNLVFASDGAIPDNPSYRVRDSELAAVRARYHAQGVPGAPADRGSLGGLTDYTVSSGGFFPVTLGTEGVEYFTPGPRVAWMNYLSNADMNEDHPVTQYAAGGDQIENWNRAPLGPRGSIGRCGGFAEAVINPFTTTTEGAVVADYTPMTGRTSLLRGGTEIAASDDPGYLATEAMPTEAGDYTLRTSATRTASLSQLATRVDAEWTFTSSADTDPNCENTEIPLLALRVTGPLDLNNQAPAGTQVALTVTASRTRGTLASANLTAVEVSSDDGATWTRAQVVRTSGTAFRVLVPAVRPGVGTGFVSLRANVRDDQGNRLTQTVIRAYQLRS